MSHTNQNQPPVAAPPQDYSVEGQAKGVYLPPGGYTQSGYPSQGYPAQGYPPQGYGYPPQGYPPQGYGYPPQGYPSHGYPQGYPPHPHYTLHYVPPQQHKPDNSFMEGCLAALCCCCLLDACF